MSGYAKKFSTIIQSELGLSEERREVIAYGIEVFVGTLLGLLGVALFGYLFGFLLPALAIALTARTARIYTGGAHCTSMVRCTIVTVIVFMVLTYAATSFLTPSLILIAGGFVISIALIARYAPAEVKEKPLSDSHKKELKKGAYKLSVVLGLSVGVLYFFFSEYFALYLIIGFLWQAFSLTPIGFTVISYMDSLLKFF